MDILVVLSFEEFKAKHQAESSRYLQKQTKCPPAYDQRLEVLPKHRWFNLDRTEADRRPSSIVDKVCNITQLSRPDDKELANLEKSATDMRDVPTTSTSEVAFVGQQGMGKSLLVNALKSRRDLSKTSAKGGACTAAAIIYRYKPGAGDFEDNYDAAVTFMDDECLREIISEHCRRYGHFHFSSNVDPDSYLEEERAAETAKEFFHLVFNAKHDQNARIRLDALSTKPGIQSGALFNETIRMAHERIAETGADADGVIYFRGLDIKGLMERVENYMARVKGHSSLWPVVHNVTIFSGSVLARNRVHLIDLPGTGDVNQSRTAATNSIRRSAGFEVIVARSDRVTTEEVVDQQIKQSIRAHGAKNTILVLTRIDEYFLDNHSVANEIQTSPQFPFPLIKRFTIETEEMLKVIDEEDDNGDKDYGAVNRHIDLLMSYHEYLAQSAQRSFIQQRAKEMEQEMRLRFIKEDPEPIHVFSVSASMYLDWLKTRQKTRPFLTPLQTGIPQLRKFLLGFSAEGNLHAYRKHAFDTMPLFLDKVRRISNHESKDSAYAVIRPKFLQLVANLKDQLDTSFNDFIQNKLLKLWTDTSQKEKRSDKIASVVRGWGEAFWNTYNKVLREKGIVARTKSKKYVPEGKTWGSINWNEEISVEILHDAATWKRKMDKAVAEFARDLESATVCACENIHESIASSSLPPKLKSIAIEEWNQRQDKVLAQEKTANAILREAVKLTYQFATTETDTRCMIAKVNWDIYDEIESIPRGTGVYSIQRDRMNAAMNEPGVDCKTLIDRIAANIRKHAKKHLRTAFQGLLTDLIKELSLYDEHIDERLPQDYDLTSLDQRLRNELKNLLPELQEEVAELQNMYTVLKIKEEPVEEEGMEPNAKRQKMNGTSCESGVLVTQYGSITEELHDAGVRNSTVEPAISGPVSVPEELHGAQGLFVPEELPLTEPPATKEPEEEQQIQEDVEEFGEDKDKLDELEELDEPGKLDVEEELHTAEKFYGAEEPFDILELHGSPELFEFGDRGQV
ncbi:hypothetical protein BDV95DRAFT_614319 [Massariosphaeria phaeospora]|uniref:Dynamin N-terminal domain-containing protein n=1 Tax=Massariosphaeria phaeospora TaxID=100035 RepID=A0A7C8MMJ7_9PLEO|nr:hypothetical protein BDV95DRAFT_614319 [Massariosphaeria phaeospora]